MNLYDFFESDVISMPVKSEKGKDYAIYADGRPVVKFVDKREALSTLNDLKKHYPEVAYELRAVNQLREGVAQTTARALAQELFADIKDLVAIRQAGATTGAGNPHNVESLTQNIRELYHELENLGYEFDAQHPGFIKPLTIDVDTTPQARLKEMRCAECGGAAFTDMILAEKQDACYYKVKSRYKVWPSAYASGALVQCRKKGAANWGNKSKNESVEEGGPFGYGAKKPRQGSVADLAAKKRKEQDKNYKPTEPKDQMVGTAKVKQGVAEGSEQEKPIKKSDWFDPTDMRSPEKQKAAYLNHLAAKKKNKNIKEQGVAEGYKEEKLKGCKCQQRQGDNKKCPIHGVQEGVAEGSLNEFAPDSGGESGRWYTDDQMTDIVGEGWYQDLDISGNVSKQEMIEEAQAWLDDQGYSVQVLNVKVNDDNCDWFIEGSFINPYFAKKGVAEGTDNPYGYKVGQQVKLDNGQQGRVLDIFDDSIEVLLPNGRTVLVDFRDARVLDEGIGRDMAKLGGIAAVGIGAGLGANYYDQQQPRVEVGGQKAYLVKNPGWGRIPDNAMTLQGKDGKTYTVWAQKGKGTTQYFATPADNVKEGVAEAGVKQLPTQGADYSKHSTAELKMMLRPGILHRNEARFKALIRKELQKRDMLGDPAPQHYRDQLAKDAAKYKKGVAEGHRNNRM